MFIRDNAWIIQLLFKARNTGIINESIIIILRNKIPSILRPSFTLESVIISILITEEAITFGTPNQVCYDSLWKENYFRRMIVFKSETTFLNALRFSRQLCGLGKVRNEGCHSNCTATEKAGEWEKWGNWVKITNCTVGAGRYCW